MNGKTMDAIHGGSAGSPHVDDAERGTTVEVTVSVPWDRVRSVLVGAFEGGCGYWCRISEYVTPTVGDVPWPGEIDSYRHVDYPVREGGAVVIEEIKGGKAKHRVDRESITKGLQVMARSYPKHFADLYNETDDADTSDVLLQCIAFGELVYG